MPSDADIALVSLGTTPGLRLADDAFAALAAECGAPCTILRVEIGAAGRLRRQVAVTDLVEALAARRVRPRARAVVFSTVTAALLAKRPDVPWAVRFDSPAALNRPGSTGLWQRRQERRVLRRAPLLLPWGEAAGAAARAELGGRTAPMIPFGVPVEAARGDQGPSFDALAYAGYPRKRGLELLVRAWAEVAPAGGRFGIGGIDSARGRDWLRRHDLEEPEGIEWLGLVERERWLGLVARARVFVNASHHEDHGISQLEALAAGTPLATVPSPGAYEALPIARQLYSQLVSPDLPRALATGLAMPPQRRAEYAERAWELLAPYRPDALRGRMQDEVLPALGLGP